MNYFLISSRYHFITANMRVLIYLVSLNARENLQRIRYHSEFHIDLDEAEIRSKLAGTSFEVSPVEVGKSASRESKMKVNVCNNVEVMTLMSLLIPPIQRVRFYCDQVPRGITRDIFLFEVVVAKPLEKIEACVQAVEFVKARIDIAYETVLEKVHMIYYPDREKPIAGAIAIWIEDKTQALLCQKALLSS